MAETYDLVSFDIFDTLVHRRLRAPVDLFEAVRLAVTQHRLALINHDILASFTHQRIQAERESREILAASGMEGEVTLDEIYDQYQRITASGNDLRVLLQQTELRLESQFLYASETGLQKFSEMSKRAGKVAFISDMYLPSEWLGKLLSDLGFENATNLPIFVSGEYRKSKHTGSLFKEVANRLEVRAFDRWLHVGDNALADITRAEEHGIKTLLADWSRVDNRRLRLGRPRSEYLVGSILDFIEMPQAQQFVPREEYSALGYLVFGPLVFGFINWLLYKTRESGIDHLVFIARDGWLPFQLFGDLKADAELGDVSQSYLHFSRAVGLQVGLKELDINQLWSPFGGSAARRIDESLKMVGLDAAKLPHNLERFGFTSGDQVTADRVPWGLQLLATSYNQILRQSAAQRMKFAQYIESHLRPGVRNGIVDIGWNGNIQRFLIASLDHRWSKEVFEGFYLGLHSTAVANRERGFLMHGWLSSYGSDPQVQQYLQEGGVELLEFALTADHGTTLGFTVDDVGKVEPRLEQLLPEEAEYRRRAILVQAGVRKFAQDYRFLLSIYCPEALSSDAWSLPFRRLVTDPRPQEIALLADLTHTDTAGTTSFRLALASRQTAKVRRSRRRLRAAREQAFWKAAFDKLNT